MSDYIDPRKEKPEDARKRRAAYCAQYGHSWCSITPHSEHKRCSYCGVYLSQVQRQSEVER